MERRARFAGVALTAVVAYFVAAAIAVTIVQGALWDLRAYHRDPIDSAWRMELAWRAWHGEWSGVDFHYPRGPLWQAVGGLAASLAGADVPWTLALLYLFFHLLSLGALLGIVLATVRGPWARVLVFSLLALLSNASGTATLRALLPLLVVLLYVPRGLDGEPRRAAPVAAGVVTVLSALVSSDRLYATGLCVGLVIVVELVVALHRRGRPRVVLERALLYGVALLGSAVVVAFVLQVLGGDPFEGLSAQRALGGAYTSHMSTEWRVDVPRANVAGLFVTVGILAAVSLLPRRADAPVASGLWLVGALPAVSFGLVRADEGHMIISMIPALVVLAIVAAGADPSAHVVTRVTAGAVAVIAIVGWFGTYPSNLAGHPRAFFEVLEIARGERRPDHDFRSDHGAARAWAARALEETPGCLAVSADATMLHPWLDVRGPTELALRWSPEMKARLAERVVRAACPIYVYSNRNYDDPGISWPFGTDFVEVARHYRLERRLGVAMLGMRWRDAPLAVARTELAAASAPARVTLPSEHRVALAAPVEGTDLVELELTLRVDTWRTYAGGTPLVEWRFEDGDEAVTAWQPLFQLALGRPSTTQIALDAEAAEDLWMTGRAPSRPRHARTLALRVSPRGLASPSAIELGIGRVTRLRLASEPAPPPPACDGEVDLMAEMREGRAYPRFVAPGRADRHLNLAPSPPGDRLAEIDFPIVPCADTCFAANLSVESTEGASDGVVAQVHVLDIPERALLAERPVPPGGEEHALEVSLERWAGRPVLLRVGTLPGARAGEDDAKLVRPRLARCRARGGLAAALARGEARVSRGAARAVGDDVEIDASGAELRMPLIAVADTCFHFGVRVTGEGATDVVSLRVRDGDVEHVLLEDVQVGGAAREDGGTWGLHDFTGREVDLVLEVTPAPSGGGPARLLAPRLHRCGEG